MPKLTYVRRVYLAYIGGIQAARPPKSTPEHCLDADAHECWRWSDGDVGDVDLLEKGPSKKDSPNRTQ